MIVAKREANRDRLAKTNVYSYGRGLEKPTLKGDGEGEQAARRTHLLKQQGEEKVFHSCKAKEEGGSRPSIGRGEKKATAPESWMLASAGGGQEYALGKI